MFVGLPLSAFAPSSICADTFAEGMGCDVEELSVFAVAGGFGKCKASILSFDSSERHLADGFQLVISVCTECHHWIVDVHILSY